MLPAIPPHDMPRALQLMLARDHAADGAAAVPAPVDLPAIPQTTPAN